MPDLPSGTVTFLFTDIEGSTALWERDTAAMGAAVERHFALLDAAISAQDGVLFKTVGDAVQAAFPSVPAAVTAAAAGQRALATEVWGDLGPLRVRMAIHAGEATPRNGDYLAPCLNRLSRVLATGYGEQVLLTETARSLVADHLPSDHDLRDLGAHRLKDLLVAERIYQLTGPGLPAEFPPLRSLNRQPHNLPAQPTALIGRDAELGALRQKLAAPGPRLITLTGPGGIGKTRLALQAAAECLEAFPDGVWWVPLAAVADPALVAPAIATPIGVREVSGEPLLDTLSEHLRSRQTLLLLDNFEQVIAAAPLVARLLDAAPGLRVLATSREPLRLRAEHEVPVAPLPLPATTRGEDSLTAAHASPAVQLFLERAQAIKPGFILDESNASAVGAICRRLDGLPLAIELAAARVRVLPPEQLLARLNQRLKLLTSGSRDLPTRQQTLRAAIEWSYDLLDANEQTLFARLAVFSGGCTVEAAEAVCDAAGDLPLDVLDGLDSLTQKSLLRPEDGADGALRFTMLETIREYGLERLDATGDAETVRRAHADYYVTLAEDAERHLTGSDQVAWLRRLESEHENVRAALDWTLSHGWVETALRLGGALWRFWSERVHVSEGRVWLERALAESQNAPDAVRARALYAAAVLAEDQGDYDLAVVHNQAALALWQALGDRSGIVRALASLGNIAHDRGDYPLALERHQAALALSQELGDRRMIAVSLASLGTVAFYQGDLDEATRFYEESLARVRELGDAHGMSLVLDNLGVVWSRRGNMTRAVALYQEALELAQGLDNQKAIASALINLGAAKHAEGNLKEAARLYEEALTLLRELGDRRFTAIVLYNLCHVARNRGDLTRAASLLVESLDLYTQMGDRSSIADCWVSIALIAEATGRPGQAARLLGAAAAAHQDLGVPPDEELRPDHDRAVVAVRDALGEAAFAAAWEAGGQLSREMVVAEVVALAEEVASGARA